MKHPTIAARQLDRKLKPFRRLATARLPRSGWLRVVRTALHMTQADVATRLKVRQPSVDGLERAEANGAITLASLRRAADALDCDLVYAIVPRLGLESSIEGRARAVAERIARGTDRSMQLEQQRVPASETQRMITATAHALSARPPRGFWKD